MKRTWILALALAVLAPIGFTGCGETEGEKVEVKKTGPEGSTTQTTETKTKVTGDGGAAPANPEAPK